MSRDVCEYWTSTVKPSFFNHPYLNHSIDPFNTSPTDLQLNPHPLITPTCLLKSPQSNYQLTTKWLAKTTRLSLFCYKQSIGHLTSAMFAIIINGGRQVFTFLIFVEFSIGYRLKDVY